MPNFRDYYFKREATVGDSDTVIIDITAKDPISFFTVEYEATNGATSSIEKNPNDFIESIELVDGADVIASLDMAQWRGVNFFENKKLPPEVINEGAAASQEQRCNLQFGRYKDDLEFYLDPSLYKNLQMRLTHDFTVSATAGIATGSVKVTVMARVIDQGAKPYKGYLMTKEISSFTISATGDHVVDLPADYPYRMLLIKSLLTAYTPQECITKLKLSCDADAHVPINDYVEDIVDMNEQLFGRAVQDVTVFSQDDEAEKTDIYDIRHATARPSEDENMITVEAVDAETVSFGVYTFSTPATPALVDTDRDIYVHVEGQCPNAMFAIPFGEINDPEAWFDARMYGDIKLVVTKAQNAACSVMIQQLRG